MVTAIIGMDSGSMIRVRILCSSNHQSSRPPLAGYGLLKEGAHNDDVPDGYGIRDNHDPERIQHAEVLDQQIRRNESSAENIVKTSAHDRISPDKILPGQRIGGKDGHREINERAKRRIYQRVGKAADDILVLKNFHVGIQVNALGPAKRCAEHKTSGYMTMMVTRIRIV